MHQARPIKGGLDFLAAAHFPTATPQELFDGHAFHMGIEISNLFRNVLQGSFHEVVVAQPNSL